MHYSFPTIEHIDQVLEAIKGDPNFKVKDSEVDGYPVTVIDYLLNTLETFPSVVTEQDGLRRECRGIIFDATGRCISRPYHKFFNLGERPETFEDKVDFSLSHRILRKLDGSMVRTIPIPGGFRLGTKAGITDVSLQAEAWIDWELDRPKQRQLEGVDLNTYTVIFEWCSRKQRIVLDYPEDKLVLTAVRNIYTGEYLHHDDLQLLGKQWGIEVVSATTPHDTIASLKSATNAEEHEEGWVVRYDNGHMLKLKSDWYVLRHKTKDSIALEKNVLALIFNNGVDDILPLLCESDRERLASFQSQVVAGIHLFKHEMLSKFLYAKENYDRKTFALTEAPKLTKNQAAIIFKAWEGKQTVSEIIDGFLQKATASASKVEENRELWGGIRYMETMTS